MNKVLLGFFLILGALGLSGYFFWSVTNSKISPSFLSEPTTPQSLKDLLEGGGSKQCIFGGTAGVGGSVYLAGGKMRGDFATKNDGQMMSSHIIVDGPKAYWWVEGQTTGLKMSWESLASNSPRVAGSLVSSTVDVNQKVNYRCGPWLPDDSFFNSEGIQFNDLDSMVIPTVSRLP